MLNIYPDQLLSVNTVGMVVDLAVDEACDQRLRRVQLVPILQMNITINQLKDIGQRLDGHSQQTGWYCVIRNNFMEQNVQKGDNALIRILQKRQVYLI